MSSEMAVAHTADQVEAPKRPALTPVLGGTGGLVPGKYSYAVSAYTGSVQYETQPSPIMVTLLRQTGSIIITLPAFPSGADGFNVYRKGPTDREMILLTSISSETATYEDTGVAPENRNHLLPTANTTHMANSVEVTPGATVPTGSTWKLYRTFVPTQWDNSLVAWIDGSLIEYVDIGHQTQQGAPALTSTATGTAPKINFTDLAEVEGALPPGRTFTMTELTFTYEGPLSFGYPEWYWVCEYDRAQPISMRAVLGKDSTPAAQEVQVGFQQWDPDYEDWFDCFGLNATVEVGENIGSLVTLDTYGATPYGGVFYRGDRVRMVVLQTGGGATPTDEDLVVTLNVMVELGGEDVTYTWES
jgi:hypothetical protein